MSNILQYKGYIASIEFSAEDKCLFGKIEHINDLIMFDGSNFDEVEQAFHNAVDNYIEFCKERGKEPQQPFKGSFNIRPGAALHRRAATEAKKAGVSLNDFVTKAIESYLVKKSIPQALPSHTKVVHQVVSFKPQMRERAGAQPKIIIGTAKERVCH